MPQPHSSEPRASARGSHRACIVARCAATVLLALACAPLRAEDPKKTDPPPPAPPPTPAPEPAPTPETPEEEKLPSLDELLGLETIEDESAQQLLEDYDPDKVQLDRKLTAQEAAEKLEQAVQQMQETAFRLEQIRDTGIVTQRLQAEVLSKLDVLIKNAQQQSQSQGQSSQSQQQQQNQQQQQQMPQQGDQSQQAANSPNTQAGEGNPAFAEGQRDQMDAARAAWGALPQRVRDRLMEGSSDYYSTWYKSLTEAYYKRIAEEASRK